MRRFGQRPMRSYLEAADDPARYREICRHYRMVNMLSDPASVSERYRLLFPPALARPADYERLMARMKAGFFAQGKAGILEAWQVEDRLMADTWGSEGYDLLPRLKSLEIATLVIYGDHDFIPGAISRHIAEAMPKARMVTLENCGHFTFMECPEHVREALK